MALDGRVTISSPDHVSLLVHRTFNVSIPRHHIPADLWEFEYGPAENDPEFGGTDDRMDVDITDVHGEDEHATDQRGRWVHKVTGDRLGGKGRWLQFTVVGYAFHLSLRRSVRSQYHGQVYCRESDAFLGWFHTARSLLSRTRSASQTRSSAKSSAIVTHTPSSRSYRIRRERCRRIGCACLGKPV